MASQNDNGFRSFIASPAISAFLVVDVLADGSISPAAGGVTAAVGVLQQDCAAGGYGQVKLFTAPGTFMIQTTALVTAGNNYSVATGGYASLVTGTTFPIALQALSSGAVSSTIEFAGKL